jgi:hypothetical protein
VTVRDQGASCRRSAGCVAWPLGNRWTRCAAFIGFCCPPDRAARGGLRRTGDPLAPVGGLAALASPLLLGVEPAPACALAAIRAGELVRLGEELGATRGCRRRCSLTPSVTAASPSGMRAGFRLGSSRSGPTMPEPQCRSMSTAALCRPTRFARSASRRSFRLSGVVRVWSRGARTGRGAAPALKSRISACNPPPVGA